MLFNNLIIIFLIFFQVICAFCEEKYLTKEVYPVVNTQYLPVLLDLINSSQEHIYICHFLWNPDTTTNKIKNALYDAINRGVDVRVLLEDSLKQNANIVKEFSDLHIPIKTDAKTDWPKNFLHTKIILVDGKKVLMGSTNLSYKAINENNETNFLIISSTAAEFYETFFKNLWDNPEGEIDLKPIATKYVTATVNRDYYSLMKEHIAKSKKRIALVFYGMRVYPGRDNEVSEFISELKKAAKRGVNIRVLLEKSSFDEKLNKGNEDAIDYLRKNKIDAKFESPDKITHAKLIIVDDTAVGVGSANFALSGFRHYNEVNAIATEPETVKFFWNYFDKLWAEKTP